MDEKFANDEKDKGCCSCPWKMCMCNMKSVWTAFVAMFVLNFAFLYIVHMVVMHFAMGHEHAQMIFFAVSAFLAATIMAWHRRCM